MHSRDPPAALCFACWQRAPSSSPLALFCPQAIAHVGGLCRIALRITEMSAGVHMELLDEEVISCL